MQRVLNPCVGPASRAAALPYSEFKPSSSQVQVQGKLRENPERCGADDAQRDFTANHHELLRKLLLPDFDPRNDNRKSSLQGRDPLHNSSRVRVGRIGMGCKADFAANSTAIDKKFNAADRPSPGYHGPCKRRLHYPWSDF